MQYQLKSELLSYAIKNSEFAVELEILLEKMTINAKRGIFVTESFSIFEDKKDSYVFRKNRDLLRNILFNIYGFNVKPIYSRDKKTLNKCLGLRISLI